MTGRSILAESLPTADAFAPIRLINVLFVTDFSSAATAALPYAADLARRYAARLYALHVRPAPVEAVMAPPGWEGLAETAASEAERAKRELLRSFQGIQPEVIVKQGDLWMNLAAAVEAHHIDFIVLGLHAHSSFARFIWGSATEEVFRQVPCPVLTLGPHFPTSPARACDIAQILLATDLQPESKAAPFALSLAREYRSHLILLHVMEDPPHAEVSRCAEALRHLVPLESGLTSAPEYLIARGSPAENILRVALEHKVDLIVLGARQPSALPGIAAHLPITTAYKVLSEAPCPVLTVRA